MKEADKRQIAEIMSQMQCPKDFECYKSGFEDLCKARDIGMEQFLVCLAENPRECKFSLPFGEGFYCNCPLRVYIAKNLRR